MPRLKLDELRNGLLRSGVSPRHVRRTVTELGDHFEDLVENALDSGADPEAARARALSDLGDLRDIAMAVRDQPELRSWAYRFPHIALVVYPITCLALLPAVPIVAGVTHAGSLARWMMCIILGGVVTAGIFLLMQLSITLG